MDRYTLNRLDEGAWGRVAALESKGPARRRLQDLGLVEGTMVRCVGSSLLGDPRAYLIRGAVVALRNDTSAGIYLE